jgi:hypothetical protein
VKRLRSLRNTAFFVWFITGMVIVIDGVIMYLNFPRIDSFIIAILLCYIINLNYDLFTKWTELSTVIKQLEDM